MNDSSPSLSTLERVNGADEPFPLTDLQLAYFLGREVHALSGNGCHIYWEFESGGWDLDGLERAWNRLVARHEMLRAVFLPSAEQRILGEVPKYPLEIHDCRGLTPAEAEARLQLVREAMSHECFAVDRWPLFRIAVSVVPGAMRLHFSMDLLIVDGTSILMLLREWAALYRHPEQDASAPAVPFREYVRRVQELKDTEEYRQSQEYWRARLDELPPPPELPLAAEMASLTKPKYRRHQAFLPKEEWMALHAQAARHGVTVLQVLLLTAFADVVARWSRRGDFTINVTVNRRPRQDAGLAQVIGDFSSNVLLAVDFRERGSLRDRALRLRRQLAADLQHASVSGVEALAELSRRRQQTVLMPVVFTTLLGLGSTETERLGRFVYGVTQTPQVMLDAQAVEHEDGLHLNWDVVEDLFPPGMPAAMFAAFARLVKELAAGDRDTWEGEWRDLLPPAQRRKREDYNSTERAWPAETLIGPVVQQARQSWNREALVCGNRRMTYGELLGRAAALADRLRTQGVQRNELVGVVMQKGWEQVVAVLAVQMAGAAYLPVEASQPGARVRELLKIGEARIALAQDVDPVDWPEAVLRLAVKGSDRVAGVDEVVAGPACPGDLAYVIFTSGSTGVPKGVTITHAAAANTVRDLNERIEAGPRDAVLALSSLSFDLSVYDIFGFLAAGGRVVMPDAAGIGNPGYLVDLVRQERVTVWNSVPSFLQLVTDYLESGAGLDSLRVAMLSGDWIPVSLPGRLQALSPDTRLMSLGGATEASIWSISYPVERVDPAWKSIPYGRPLTNQTFHVLNQRLEDCPDGVQGELYIGGVGLAAGYWRDEEKTRASFIQHPRTGERLYRTGDWGAHLDDGNIEFLGRVDLQVKIGGHRVELGEVDAALSQCPGVAVGMAVTFADEHRQKRLAAGFVRKPGAAVDAPGVRNFLAARLPGYMVPAHIFQLPELPLTANGKVDRKAVEALAARQAGSSAEAGLQQEDDPFLRAMASATLGMDPHDRERFVDARMGVRSDLDGSEAIALGGTAASELVVQYERRRSSRSFAREPIALRQLGGLLGLLRGISIGGRPKHLYPSAGSSYAVQTYVHVKAGRVRDLDAGVYYYHPLRDELRRVGDSRELPPDIHAPVNRPVFASAAFSIFLIGDSGAIRPLYGDLAPDFLKLEAGYMGQLLMEGALPGNLGLCPIGYVGFDAIRDRFQLTGDHILLHSFLGGGYVDEAEVAASPEPLEAARQTGADSIEERLAAIWTEVLRRPQLDRDENFFEAGGTSFAAVEVHRRITGGLGIACTITDLFRHPTVRSLAARLEALAPSGIIAEATAPPEGVGADSGLSRRERRLRARRDSS